MRHLRSCISIFTSMGSCFKSITAKSISAAMLILFSSASMANTASWGSFNGTTIDGDTYTFPTGAEGYAGFSNSDDTLYPFCFGDGGSVSLTAAVPNGGDANLRFRFEYKPWPDVNPNIDNLMVAVSGDVEQSYSVDIPAQAADQTFSSLVMYIADRDVPVTIKDVTISSTACPSNSISLTVLAPDATMVLLATNIDGKTIGNPSDAYTATSNGDDTWTVVLDSAPGSFSYQWVSDSGLSQVDWEDLISQNDSGLCEQENLVDSVAYRQWVAPEGGITESVVIDSDVFNTCNALDTDGDGTADIIDNDDDNDGIEDVNDPLPLDADANFTDVTRVAFSEAFGDTNIGDGLAYIHPADAQVWGGFANMNASLYPLKLTEAGTVTFNASVPSGGDVNVRFRFEANAHPATEPSFDTDPVLVSGSEVTSYTINVPAQGSNTFNSLLMYLGGAKETPDTDVAVVITDVVANVDADSGGGVDPAVGGTVTFSVDMTGVDLDGSVPTVEGSFNNYCGGCAEMSDENNDGVWLLDIELEPGFHTYVYKLDGAQEPLTADASCASVSLGEEDENGNQAEFINRTVSVDGDAVLATANYGGCAADYEGTGDTGGTDPVAPTIALPVDFEAAADAYEIAGFDGGVATVEAGPDGAVSLKYVKGAGQNWAGVWIDLDTAVDAANGE
ncbi:MAG: hypothetical protein HON20_04050, partial [Cellvibrionales bacterium]|nr:hypothetical protein [Cellvibrionales bacterium]